MIDQEMKKRAFNPPHKGEAGEAYGRDRCGHSVVGGQALLCDGQKGRRGGTLPALSGIALTDREDLVPQDEILLCGPDLSELGEDTPYARLALIRVRESARVSRQALKEGLDFAHVGQAFLQTYHEHPAVEAVRLIFITRPDYPYDQIKDVVQRSQDITKALDHVMKNVKMDCASCGLKEVCAEVETLYHTQFPQ